MAKPLVASQCHPVMTRRTARFSRRQQERRGDSIMKVKTSFKAVGESLNHNETLVRDAAKAKAKGLNVKTNVKAGVITKPSDNASPKFFG
jgi:hypothetical protein